MRRRELRRWRRNRSREYIIRSIFSRSKLSSFAPALVHGSFTCATFLHPPCLFRTTHSITRRIRRYLKKYMYIYKSENSRGENGGSLFLSLRWLCWARRKISSFSLRFLSSIVGGKAKQRSTTMKTTTTRTTTTKTTTTTTKTTRRLKAGLPCWAREPRGEERKGRK